MMHTDTNAHHEEFVMLPYLIAAGAAASPFVAAAIAKAAQTVSRKSEKPEDK